MILIDFYVEQKTAYELRISDWSSDVCSSDLGAKSGLPRQSLDFGRFSAFCRAKRMCRSPKFLHFLPRPAHCSYGRVWIRPFQRTPHGTGLLSASEFQPDRHASTSAEKPCFPQPVRSEEHTSELQSLMRNPYSVFCL